MLIRRTPDSGAAVHTASVIPLRWAVVCVGVLWSLAFIAVGLGYDLEMYGDGSIFTYSVAVQNAWAIHWHNIPGRLTVYLLCILPAETFIGLTNDADGGIVIYATLFFSAQLMGLAVTFAADRSADRILFTFACASTACLCPLVFGFPTELWIAHAFFWPCLTLCFYARRTAAGFGLVFVALLALVLTHEGAVGLALAIVAALSFRGLRDFAFVRAVVAVALALACWLTLKFSLPPDDYISPVLANAELNFFAPRIFTTGLFALLALALLGVGGLFTLLIFLRVRRAAIFSGTIILVTLVGYFVFFDHALHAENRYYLRTVLFLFTPAFGLAAALRVNAVEGRLRIVCPALPVALFSKPDAAILAGAAIVIITFVNIAETARFITRWEDYTSAVRALTIGTQSDPALGDERFVSSGRIGRNLQPLAWSSTMPFLSVLVAPNFLAKRLVVDPSANFFWFSCAVAKANELARRAIAVAPRQFLRNYTCRHRSK